VINKIYNRICDIIKVKKMGVRLEGFVTADINFLGRLQ
jgi:hypothetical protein